MATNAGLALATIIHILLRVSIFLEQPLNTCSVAPSLASLIYLASTLMIIYDYNIYPRKYKNIPIPCQIFVEVILCLLLIEFSTVIVWCSLEKTFHRLLKCILLEKASNMYYDMGGDFLVGALLTFASAFIFVNVALATDLYYTMRKKAMFLYRRIVEKIKKMWSSLPLCYEQKPSVCPLLDYDSTDDSCSFTRHTRQRTMNPCPPNCSGKRKKC